MNPLALRDGLLASLLEDPSTLLIQRDEAFVRLRLATGVQVALVACPVDGLLSALRPTLDALLHEKRTGILHVVVVGGGPALAGELERGNWRFGLHHLDSEAKLERVAGHALPQLARAAQKATGVAPLDEERIAARLAQGSQWIGEQARFAEALRGRFPWFTASIAFACLVLFALGKYWADGNFSAALFRMGANSGPHVQAGEVWRLLASAFLHADVVHVAVNMLALVSFGSVLEKLLGPRRYIVLYGLSALGGGLASALLRGPGLAVGASGAIWGLMAAGVGLAIRPRGLLPPLSLVQVRRRATVPLVVNFLYSFQPGIDLYAHFGGGLVGLALMVSGAITYGVDPVWTEASATAPSRPGRSVGLTLGAAALLAAMAGSVFVALVAGQPWKLSEPIVLERVEVADTGLSVELPSAIAHPPTVEQVTGARIFTFGNLLADPVAIELVVNVLPQALPPEELDAAMETEREAAQSAAPRGAERQGDATIVTLDGRPVVTVTHRLNTITIRTWAWILGDREVILRVYSRPDRSASWSGVEDRIAASLRAP